MSDNVIGIDPGNEGALALLSLVEGELLELEDMPVVDDGVKGRRTVNAPLLAALIRRLGAAPCLRRAHRPAPERRQDRGLQFRSMSGLDRGRLCWAWRTDHDAHRPVMAARRWPTAGRIKGYGEG